MSGKIDLIRSDDGTVEIVDFKAEQKPDAEEQATYNERYKKQLQVYAHLVEERTGNRVSKLTLYYTGDNSGNPTITFPYVKADVKKTIDEFDTVVHKIKCKDFSGRTTNPKTCSNCDFRHYCKHN